MISWKADNDISASDRNGIIEKLNEAYRATKRRRLESNGDLSNTTEDDTEVMCQGTKINYFTMAQKDIFTELLSRS